MNYLKITLGNEVKVEMNADCKWEKPLMEWAADRSDDPATDCIMETTNLAIGGLEIYAITFDTSVRSIMEGSSPTEIMLSQKYGVMSFKVIACITDVNDVEILAEMI